MAHRFWCNGGAARCGACLANRIASVEEGGAVLFIEELYAVPEARRHERCSTASSPMAVPPTCARSSWRSIRGTSRRAHCIAPGFRTERANPAGARSAQRKVTSDRSVRLLARPEGAAAFMMDDQPAKLAAASTRSLR